MDHKVRTESTEESDQVKQWLQAHDIETHVFAIDWTVAEVEDNVLTQYRASIQQQSAMATTTTTTTTSKTALHELPLAPFEKQQTEESDNFLYSTRIKKQLACRNRRYHILEREAPKLNIKLYMTAHHQGDNVCIYNCFTLLD